MRALRFDLKNVEHLGGAHKAEETWKERSCVRLMTTDEFTDQNGGGPCIVSGYCYGGNLFGNDDGTWLIIRRKAIDVGPFGIGHFFMVIHTLPNNVINFIGNILNVSIYPIRILGKNFKHTNYRCLSLGLQFVPKNSQ